MEAIYRSLLDLLGFRTRHGLSVRQFAIAATALTEGCVLRDRVDSVQMNAIIRPTGRDGEDQEWALFGFALFALTEQFFELDPEWADPAPMSPRAEGSSAGPPQTSGASSARSRNLFLRSLSNVPSGNSSTT